jgi:hypothetical protein
MKTNQRFVLKKNYNAFVTEWGTDRFSKKKKSN